MMMVDTALKYMAYLELEISSLTFFTQHHLIAGMVYEKFQSSGSVVDMFTKMNPFYFNSSTSMENDDH
jgi:hypothetical protein